MGFQHALVHEDFFPHMFNSQMLTGLAPRLTPCSRHPPPPPSGEKTDFAFEEAGEGVGSRHGHK